jgi:hypothetical protein
MSIAFTNVVVMAIMDSDNLKWDHGIFVLVLIILILLIVLLYKRISCRNMHTTLCLQISDGFQCVMIPIMHLPLNIVNLSIDGIDWIWAVFKFLTIKSGQ